MAAASVPARFKSAAGPTAALSNNANVCSGAGGGAPWCRRYRHAVVTDDDWRLMGQERYLSGAEFRRAAWSPHKEGWDHDHCAFCQGEFSAEKSHHVDYTAGFVTTDGRHEWVCATCFEDFKDRFGFTVASD
jgi:hypothetical protein